MKLTAFLALIATASLAANAAVVPPTTSDAADACASTKCADGYTCKGILIRGKTRAFCVPASDADCACAPTNVKLCPDGKHVDATICRANAVSSDNTVCTEQRVTCPRACVAEVDCDPLTKPSKDSVVCKKAGSVPGDAKCKWSARANACAWATPKCVLQVNPVQILTQIAPAVTSIFAESHLTLPVTLAVPQPTGAAAGVDSNPTGASSAELVDIELPEGVDVSFLDGEDSASTAEPTPTSTEEAPVTLPPAAPEQTTDAALDAADVAEQAATAAIGAGAPGWVKDLVKGGEDKPAEEPAATSEAPQEPTATTEPAPEEPAATTASVPAAATVTEEAPAASSTASEEVPAATETKEAPASTEAAAEATTTAAAAEPAATGDAASVVPTVLAAPGSCSIAPCNFRFCAGPEDFLPMVCDTPKSASDKCFAKLAKCQRNPARKNKCSFVIDRKVFAQCVVASKSMTTLASAAPTQTQA